MGKVHNTIKQRPGYNVFKTLVALKLASREKGVKVTELSEVGGCSKAAALSTLNHLVTAGECVRIDDDGGPAHYHSDVYSKIDSGHLIRKGTEPQNIDPPDTYKDAVTSVVIGTQGGMIAQYPVSIFGEQGLFVSRVIAKVCKEILGGINEIT